MMHCLLNQTSEINLKHLNYEFKTTQDKRDKDTKTMIKLVLVFQ